MPQDRARKDTISTMARHEALQATELTLWEQEPGHRHSTAAVSPSTGTWACHGEGLDIPAFFSLFSFFALSVSSSKFRTAVFGWCCLGYMPEPQLHRSLGNQASDISLFCNGTARAPSRLMRWEIPKRREEFQMVWNKRMANTVTTATFPSRGRTGLQN